MTLRPEQLGLLRLIAGAMLPGEAGAAPSGAEVDLTAPLAADPAFAEEVARGLDAIALAACVAYYADPRVRAALGYEGPRAAPPPPFEAGVLDPLIARVRARGARYRDAPPT